MSIEFGSVDTDGMFGLRRPSRRNTRPLNHQSKPKKGHVSNEAHRALALKRKKLAIEHKNLVHRHIEHEKLHAKAKKGTHEIKMQLEKELLSDQRDQLNIAKEEADLAARHAKEADVNEIRRQETARAELKELHNKRALRALTIQRLQAEAQAKAEEENTLNNKVAELKAQRDEAQAALATLSEQKELAQKEAAARSDNTHGALIDQAAGLQQDILENEIESSIKTAELAAAEAAAAAAVPDVAMENPVSATATPAPIL